VTQDEKRTVLRGDVLIADGKIAEVGKSLPQKADVEVDAHRMLVAPGFINLHTHVANTLLRGVADDLDFGGFLEKMFSYDAKRTEADIEVGALLGGAEMLLGGTTTYLDMYYGMDAVGRASERLGIRSFLGWAVLDAQFTTQKGIPVDNAREFMGRWKNHELVTPLPAPQGVYVVSEETWLKTKELADQKRSLVHYHLSETLKEVEDHVGKHGLRPVEWLEKIGFLGPGQIAAHSVWLKNNEIALMAQRKVAAAHCPSSNMKLASGGGGLCPVTELRAQGAVVGIGTDSSTSSNTLSMLRLTHLTGLAHKHARHDPKSLPAQVLLDMATREGARALGQEGFLGTIVPGAAADLVLYDMAHPSLAPVDTASAVANLVYSANEGAVNSVFVGGRPVVDRGRLAGLGDEELEKIALSPPLR
jgi:5-methylthioadenosine/S-adenosylhomocysteine deaminase